MHNLTLHELTKIATEIEKKFGFHYEEIQIEDLKRQLEYAFSVIGEEGSKKIIKNLLSTEPSTNNLDSLKKYLTIGETYFFREEKTLDVLVKNLLPKLLENSNQINILSAACSTGEEPYSVAMLINELMPNNWSKIKIYATDLNDESIQKARNACYRNWSFRNTTDYYRTKYFKKDGNFELLIPEIKNMVNFQQLNLLNEKYPDFLQNQSMDVILFRNTMIYFSQKVINQVLSHFNNIMKKDSYLLVGVTEASLVKNAHFLYQNSNGIPVYKKTDGTNLSKRTFQSVKPTIHQPRVTPSLTKINKTLTKKISVATRIKKTKNKAIKPFNITQEFEKGNYSEIIDKAPKIIEKSVSQNAENVGELYYYFAKSYANIGKINEAIDNCIKGLKYESTNYDLNYLISQLYIEEENLEAALSHLERCLLINENAPMPLFLLSTIHYKIGEHSKSAVEMESLISSLSKLDKNLILEEADGLNVGRMMDIVETMKNKLN